MLSPNELRVVRIDLTTCDWLAAERWLDSQESEHARGLYFEADRNEYRRAHAALRQMLGAELGAAPGSLRFSQGPHGKPSLVDAELQFSLSHSHGVALVALAPGAVGVDAERVRAERVVDDVERLYSPRERAALAALPAEHRSAAFFRAWVRKEAVLKARGSGLTAPLRDFEVTLAPGEPPRLLATRPDPAEASRWTLADVPMPSGWVAAVAVAADCPLHLTVVEARPSFVA